jgi:riboflavin biosynthesis pyrimidine reductase
MVRPACLMVGLLAALLTNGLWRIHPARLPTLLPREYQPQPIILDSYLRTPPACRLIRNYLNKLQPIPVVVGSKKLLEEMPYLDAELDEAGAEVATCPVDGRPPLRAVFHGRLAES